MDPIERKQANKREKLLANIKAKKNAAYAAKQAGEKAAQQRQIEFEEIQKRLAEERAAKDAKNDAAMASIIPTQDELVSDRAWWDPRRWVGLGRRTRKSRSHKMRKSRSRKMRV